MTDHFFLGIIIRIFAISSGMGHCAVAIFYDMWEITVTLLRIAGKAVTDRDIHTGRIWQDVREASVRGDGTAAIGGLVMFLWRNAYVVSPAISIINTVLIMSRMASQIASVLIVYSIVCSGAYQRKHQSSVSKAFVTGDRWIPRTKDQ